VPQTLDKVKQYRETSGCSTRPIFRGLIRRFDSTAAESIASLAWQLFAVVIVGLRGVDYD